MRPTLLPEDEALVRQARAHWARMRDDPEGCGEEPTDSDCALCRRYLRDLACTGCLVVQVTGEDFCKETPYGDASARHCEMMRTEPCTDARRCVVLAFREAANRVIAWIDENLLTEEEDALKCPKCGSKDISLHLCFNNNTAGCRTCRHQWMMDTVRAALPYSGDPPAEQAVVPEPEELRRIVLESVERNKESTKRIADVICGHLPESCRIANDQQLPSEITRATEGKRDNSRESGGEERR